METRSIGSLEVTVVGLGTNNFGFGMPAEDVPPVVNAALDAGINFFDTADCYGESEARLAQALGARRDEVVIATKFGNPVQGEEGTGGARPEYVVRALEASLRRLGTDRIDLYQLHVWDPATPISETYGALADAVRDGKVREIGCSNFNAEQLREAHDAAGGGPQFVSVQNHYNLLNRRDEAEVLPTCRELGIAYLPYFPLASGVLTGKYVRGESPPAGTRLSTWGKAADKILSERTFDALDALSEWSRGHGRSLLDVAIAWLVAQEGVASVAAGATKPDQVAANVEGGQWHLSADDVAEIDAVMQAPDRDG